MPCVMHTMPTPRHTTWAWNKFQHQVAKRTFWCYNKTSTGDDDDKLEKLGHYSQWQGH